MSHQWLHLGLVFGLFAGFFVFIVWLDLRPRKESKMEPIAKPVSIDEQRASIGLPPLPKWRLGVLPSHLRWFFGGWFFTIAFGLLAHHGLPWLAASALVLAFSCYLLAHWRVRETGIIIDRRHPYRG